MGMDLGSDSQGKDETSKLKDAKGGPSYNSVESVRPSICGRSTLVEPVMFLYMVATHLSDSVITNLLEYRTCKLEFGFSDGNCTEPISHSIESLIQPTTADIIMGRMIIGACVSSCLAVFIGPWSDNNGRKSFLVISLSGAMLSYLCWGFMALVPGLHPQVFLLPSIPFALTGGSSAIYLLTYCYISDVTNERTRPFRMSLLVLSISTSSLLGTACAPLLVNLQNTVNPYPLVFFLSAFLLLMNIIYTRWYIIESVDIKEDREKRLFLFSHVRNMYSVCFKPREGHARPMSLLIVFTLTSNIFFVSGEGAILYLSTRAMFFWQLADFSMYVCFNCVVQGVGILLGVWLLSSVLGLPNMPAAALMLFTYLARCVILASARTGRDFYFAALVACMAGAYVPLCRTELSRLVPRYDLGKIFALTAFLESLSPMAAAPLYSSIYEATFLDSPITVYCLSVALSFLCLVMITTVAILQKMVKGACYVREGPRQPDSAKAPDGHQKIDTKI